MAEEAFGLGRLAVLAKLAGAAAIHRAAAETPGSVVQLGDMDRRYSCVLSQRLPTLARNPCARREP